MTSPSIAQLLRHGPSAPSTTDDVDVYRIAANVLGIATSGTERWRVDANGHLLGGADGSYDIGADGSRRPRDLYVARDLTVSGLAAASYNGQKVRVRALTELTTIAAAATTDTTIQIPANAIVVAVSVRVTVAIPTAATFDVGVAGATTRYGSGLSTAADTTNPGTNDGLRFYAAAAAVRITPNLTPAANTGRVRVTIHYLDVVAPTA